MGDGRRRKRRIGATTAHSDDITDNADDIRQRQKRWKEGDGGKKRGLSFTADFGFSKLRFRPL